MRGLEVRSKKKLTAREKGSILLLGLIVSILILFTTVAAVSTTLTLGKEAKYKIDRTRALAAAEGVTETAQKRVLEQVSNFEAPTLGGTVDLGGSTYPYTITPI